MCRIKLADNFLTESEEPTNILADMSLATNKKRCTENPMVNIMVGVYVIKAYIL